MMTPLANIGINALLVKLRQLHFDENTDKNLAAVVYFQCRLFEHRILKPQNLLNHMALSVELMVHM